MSHGTTTATRVVSRALWGSVMKCGSQSLKTSFFCCFLFCKTSSPGSGPTILPQTPSQTNTQKDELITHQLIDTARLSGIDTLSYVLGKFDPTVHPGFTKVPIGWASREGMYLRKETWNAFLSMAEAAAKDGIRLKIVSATRNYEAQKKIWEDKWTGKTLVEDGQNLSLTVPDPVLRAKKILEFSSMPSTSRHHWGTDMDLNALNNSYFLHGEGKKTYDWLVSHADRYGFCQPYTANRPYGYNEEKWHWTYLPISKPLTDFCARKLSNDQIKGFKGSQTASAIDVVKKYVLGINCRSRSQISD